MNSRLATDSAVTSEKDSLQAMSKDTRSANVYDVLKGILILVIIAGHNEAICWWSPALRQVFYYFNVQCFFILSVILDRRPFSTQFLIDRAVRYLVPYGVFMAIAAAAWLALRGFPGDSSAWGRSFALALYNGNESSIHDAVGMRVFWFLPSLFSLVMVRALWTSFAWSRAPIIVAGVVWMLVVARVSPDLLRSIPLGGASALFFYPLCLVARWLHDRTTPAIEPMRSLLATCVSVICGVAVVNVPLGWVAAANPSGYDPASPATFVIGLVFPAAMFFSLVAASRLLQHDRFLMLCGRHSLVMFLVHMFVYRGLTLVVFGGRFTSPEIVGQQLAIGLLVFAATVLTSLAMAVAITHWPRLNALLFPRDWSSWRTALAGSGE